MLENIRRCFEVHKPLVVGTTGWYDQLPEIEKQCRVEEQSFFYASNLSEGVNLFFRLNRYLAKLMTPHAEYDVSMEEIHHTSKKDAPSGTAIMIADAMNEELSSKWKDLRGLEIVSFNVQNFTDDQNLIENLGIDNIVKIKHPSTP